MLQNPKPSPVPQNPKPSPVFQNPKASPVPQNPKPSPVAQKLGSAAGSVADLQLLNHLDDVMISHASTSLYK